MAQGAATLSTALQSRKAGERTHKVLVWIFGSISLLICSALTAYGYDYYLMAADQRPYSDKHELLRPSGEIGLNLGIFGTVLFVIIFMYALRKFIPFLNRLGNARHWMDFHVICGMLAPMIIAFHASFKFNNIAGVAFWIMLAVALSGVIGRYLYSQIPRSLNAAALNYHELEAGEDDMADALTKQSLFDPMYLQKFFAMPSAEHVRKTPTVFILIEMLFLDIERPFKIAKLRRKELGFGTTLLSLGGLLSFGSPELENVIRLVRAKASLSKRILFLDRTQKIFHLWHVVHRPFSYAFVVLAVIHIVNAVRLGYY